MRAFNDSTTLEPNDGAEEARLQSHKSFPVLVRYEHKRRTVPHGLVVTGDDSIRTSVSESLLLCGTAPILATSIRQASQCIRTGKAGFGVCEDKLPDGNYEDLLLLNRVAESPLPWIVVSRTGDWPDYLAAIELGAYDFLGYPVMYGELSRIVRALLEKSGVAESATSISADGPYRIR